MPRPTVPLIALAAFASACSTSEEVVGLPAPLDTSEEQPPGMPEEAARTARPADQMPALRRPAGPVRR